MDEELELDKNYQEKILNDLSQEEQKVNDQLRKLLKDNSQRKEVMRELHRYNDVKDAAQIILGKLAMAKGTTLSALHKQFLVSDIED